MHGVRPVNPRRFVLRFLLPFTAVVVVSATLLAGGRASPRPPAPPSVVTVVFESAGKRLAAVRAPSGNATRIADAARSALPPSGHDTSGGVSRSYSYDTGGAVQSAIALRERGGTVQVRRAVTDVLIDAPTVGQALANNCEAASLQILLATLGVRRDQLTLQGELPRSGPLDPVGSGPSAVWGDPRDGFVGRPDGSGPAGGFGVYQGPIAQVAQRNGRTLRDLTGSTVGTLLGELRAGHAVMAWVALSQGPYGHWRSPSGQPVAVNFGEHAVVLVGVGPNGLTVKNPLQGTTEVWSLARFSSSWPALGRRALAAA